MKRYLILIAAAALACSCTVMRQVDYKQFAARNIEPRQDALITPLKADMELTSETRIDKSYPFLLKKNQPLSDSFIAERKLEALAAAAQEYKADVIIGALTSFEYKEVSGKRREFIVRVTGYPARYVNFQQVGPEDRPIMEYYLNTNQTEVARRNAGVTNR